MASSAAALRRVVALAADLFETDVAMLVSFDGDRAEVLAEVGFDGDVASRGFPADIPLSEPSPCAVPDTALDPRFDGHPLATAAPHARFYAGAPLLSPDGAVIGALCALDGAPRPPPSRRDMGRLAALAGIAADVLEGNRARDRAEAEAVAKAELLADVSHELRTPLNGIVGFTQILKRDGRLDAEALRNVERIEEAGRGLLSIVGDALDLSTLASGTVRLDLRPFSASRLLEDAVAMVRPDADRKGLALVVDLPAGPVGPLLGDPDRLRQVLLNLLSNAVKFTGAGTIRASLSADEPAVPERPVALCFAVEDSGVGITSDGIPRLFRRFAQADGSVARRFGGTGLGLAISKTLVEAMGGSIAVESAPGAGARFSVLVALPRAVDHRPMARVARSHRPLRRGSLRGLAILLAEDAPMNQKLATQMLAPLGAEIDVVGDGLAAVEAVAARDYALVLMDMEMPVLGGLDATRRIRALPGTAGSVPIVALTANAFPEQLDQCREVGMDDHLTKPFGPDALAAVALRWARRLVPADGA